MSAPELLAALQWALPYAEAEHERLYPGETFERDGYVAMSVELARAAIAKATGVAQCQHYAGDCQLLRATNAELLAVLRELVRVHDAPPSEGNSCDEMDAWPSARAAIVKATEVAS